MARGIFASWKTPVYINFDEPMTRSKFEEIVLEVESTGLRVRACTFDLGMLTVDITTLLCTKLFQATMSF